MRRVLLLLCCCASFLPLQAEPQHVPPVASRGQLHAALSDARNQLRKSLHMRTDEAFVKQLESVLEAEMESLGLRRVSFTYRSDGLLTLETEFEPTVRLLMAIENPALESKLTAQEKGTLAAARALCRQALAGAESAKEKALALHDALVNLAHYDKSRGMEPWDVLLAPHGGVCLAYARAYRILMTLAGVPNKLVLGWAKEYHAWNQVQIEGVWYHVDCTWDDPVTRGYRCKQTLTHDYFLRTDEQMRETHRWK